MNVVFPWPQEHSKRDLSPTFSLFLFWNTTYTVSKVSLICKGSDQDPEHTIILFVLNIRTCTCDRASLHKQIIPSCDKFQFQDSSRYLHGYFPFSSLSGNRIVQIRHSFHKINMCTNVTHSKSKFNVVRHRKLSTASRRKDILCFHGFFIAG